MTAHSRIRRIGWIALLAICTGLYLMLHLKVHAVTSDVIRSERQIVALEQEKLLLQTEFETRASQLQLAAWNRVDFGYVAPTAAQFLDNERQLAALGTPRAPGAPEPILVAGADPVESFPSFAELVPSRNSGQGDGADMAGVEPRDSGRIFATAALAPALAQTPLGEAGIGEAGLGGATLRIPLAAMVRVATE